MKHIQKIAPFAAMAAGAGLALATSAFKHAPQNKSGDPMYTFQYNPPGGTDYSATSVQDVANWGFTSTPPACLGSDKACTLEVPAAYVDNPGSSPTLDASIDIITGGSSTVANVQSTAADNDGAVIANQPD